MQKNVQFNSYFCGRSVVFVDASAEQENEVQVLALPAL